MIVEKIIENKQRKFHQTPVRSNRASLLGHPCLKYLVLKRLKWEEELLPSRNLQLIFDEGKLHEQQILKEMIDAGLEIIETQRMFEWREFQITGHIDCKVKVNSSVYPVEIKSCSDFVFSKINSAKDLYESDRHYIRMYPAQMTLYLLMDNKEEGIFIFKNKQTGELKEIPMKLDYSLGENLLQKAEKINDCVKKNEIPEQEIFDEDLCSNCSFRHICLPEIARESIEIAPDAAEILDRYFELKPLVKEYHKLDKKIRAMFKEKERVLCGSYLITGKWVKRKAYQVPESQYWQPKIIKIK